MRLPKFMRTWYFWSAAALALFAGLSSYAPQWSPLLQHRIQTDWQVDYYVAGYRLLFPLSALIAAWQFGRKGGLIICFIIGPVILSSVFVNSRLPYAWLDIGDIAIGVALSWVVGKQGELKKRLEETTAELIKQSSKLKEEIAERKQAEEKYKLITENTADVIYKIGVKEGQYTYVSPSGERLFGYTEKEALKLTTRNVLTPESFEKQQNELIKDLQNNISFSTLQLNVIHKDGHIIPVEVHASFVYDEKGEPVEIVGVARDITQRRKMEEQLIMQDRLASIGQLTSGLAHELNNPLTSVISFSSLLLEQDLPDDVKQDVKTINEEALRTANIVKNLLNFAQKQPQEKAPVNINDSINKVLELRAYEQKVNNIIVDTHLAPDLPLAMGNSSELQQVFFNVLINAEFFMLKAHGKGNMKVTTEKAGANIRIKFADDGPGISAEDMKHLFTPFFSTKEVGKGTGLSLSICQGIIAAHEGRIWAESEIGKGSNFFIELPVYGKMTV
jgi:PAS domain S-box-containing protein